MTLFQKGCAFWWARCWLASAEGSQWCWHCNQNRLAMVQVSSAPSLSQEKTKLVQHQSTPWLVKALEKDGSRLKIEHNVFILTWTSRRELMIGECMTLKVFSQISEYAASPTELRAGTEQHFPAKTTAPTASTNEWHKFWRVWWPADTCSEHSTAAKHVKPLKSLTVRWHRWPNQIFIKVI